MLISSWEQGAKLFNEKLYWEAHEAWEQGWKTLGEPEKTHVQALIQVAAAFHLQKLGRFEASAKQFRSALTKLARTESAMSGIYPRVEISECRQFLESLGDLPVERPSSLKAHVVQAR